MRNGLVFKGIFCLEGDWGNMRDRTSIEPMLEMLNRKYNSKVKYICRDVATAPEFMHYLKKWKQKNFADHPILYLCFHGSEACLHVGGERPEGFVSLDSIEEELLGADLRRRILYFGSCSTLNVSEKRIKNFINNTGLAGIIGYAADVNWIDSAALDLIMLDWLQNYSITAQGLNAIKGKVRSDLRGLITKLKLKIVTR